MPDVNEAHLIVYFMCCAVLLLAVQAGIVKYLEYRDFKAMKERNISRKFDLTE